MPRAKKPQVAPGETYGERQQLEAMANQGPPQAPPIAMPMPGGPQLQAAAVAQAAAMPAMTGILGAPSERPNEPITAGLSIGAGPGPEALRGMGTRQTNVQRQLEQAAQVSGNTRLQQMAARVRQQQMRSNPMAGGR